MIGKESSSAKSNGQPTTLIQNRSSSGIAISHIIVTATTMNIFPFAKALMNCPRNQRSLHG